jgi:hypothetical protein
VNRLVHGICMSHKASQEQLVHLASAERRDDAQ